MSFKNTHIYLDYSATTPVDPVVSSYIHDHLMSTFGNASSVHLYGRAARVLLEESREIIANSIGAETSEIFFTSGGTESDNHALIGVVFAHRFNDRKSHILVSSAEHHAVLDCAEYLKTHGVEVSFIPVDENGVVHPDAVEKLLTPKTRLISVMHTNNETGVIQPIGEISEIARKHSITFHSDAVQSFGKIPVDVTELGVDMISLSAHKIYGPKGVGALFIKKGTNIDALLHGGSQERKNRPGTENIPLIVGFAKAAHLISLRREEIYQHVTLLKAIARNKIAASVKSVIFNGDLAKTVPHILSVSLDSKYYDIEGESLLLNMDLKGVAVSSGSACTSGSIQPSHVLLAMGRDKKTTQATIRFSFGRLSTVEDVENAIDIFCSISNRFLRN